MNRLSAIFPQQGVGPLLHAVRFAPVLVLAMLPLVGDALAQTPRRAAPRRAEADYDHRVADHTDVVAEDRSYSSVAARQPAADQPPAPIEPQPAPPAPAPPASPFDDLGLTVGGGAATMAGAAAPLAAAPYMIGDFFGGATTGSGSTVRILRGTTGGPSSGGPFSPVGPDPIVGQVVFPTISAGNVATTPRSVENVTTINEAINQGNTTFELVEDPAVTAVVQQTVGDPAGQIVELDTSEARLVGQLDNPQAGVTTRDEFTFFTTYNLFEEVVLDIPSPGAGGVVGRMKIAENSSPMPRDRVFFNYSYFDNVPLTSGGVNVSRFAPGFEKTFFDRMTSIDVRFPLASTLDSDLRADGLTNTGETEFGNITVTFKALLASTDSWGVSAGLGVAVPTADDVRVLGPGDQELVRIRNESVHLMPFVGWLYAPNDRFFSQSFLQIDVDANGNPVAIDATNTGLQTIGRINDVTFLYADLGIGYWMYRSNCPHCRLTGFAPTLELHYNRSLQSTDVVRGGGFQIGNFADNIELMNVVIGGTWEFGRNKTITAGYATPIVGGSDRQFDGELRVTVNWLFGPQNRLTRTPFF